MKRIAAVWLAVGLVAGLAGCASGKKETTGGASGAAIRNAGAETLPVPASEAPETVLEPDPSFTETYVVRPGDSLWKIARLYDTSTGKLRVANRLKTDVIRPGQTLKVPPLPAGASIPAPAPAYTPPPPQPAPAPAPAPEPPPTGLQLNPLPPEPAPVPTPEPAPAPEAAPAPAPAPEPAAAAEPASAPFDSGF